MPEKWIWYLQITLKKNNYYKQNNCNDKIVSGKKQMRLKYMFQLYKVKHEEINIYFQS